MHRAIACSLIVLATLSTGWAADKTITLPQDDAYAALKDGPGVQATRNACGFCHSTDYVVMQPGGDAKQWQAVVTKMIKVYGAPIGDADAKAIVEYLATAYGPAR